MPQSTYITGSVNPGYSNLYPIPTDNAAVVSNAMLSSLLQPFADNIALVEQQINNYLTISLVPSQNAVVGANNTSIKFGGGSNGVTAPGLPSWSQFGTALSGAFSFDAPTGSLGSVSGGLNFGNYTVFSTNGGPYTGIAKAKSYYHVDVSFSIFGSVVSADVAAYQTVVGALFCSNAGSGTPVYYPGASSAPVRDFLSWQSFGVGSGSYTPEARNLRLSFNVPANGDNTPDEIHFYLGLLQTQFASPGDVVISYANLPDYVPMTVQATVTSY